MASNDEPKKNTAPPRQGDASRNLDSLGMDELLSLGYDKSTIAEGEIVTGRVLKVTPSDVVIDVGYKSEGLLPVGEVTGYDGQVRVKRGDDLEVFIERLEDPSGYVILSREKAARMRVWDDIEAAFKSDQPITGRVVDRVKGGLSVDVGGVNTFREGVVGRCVLEGQRDLMPGDAHAGGDLIAGVDGHVDGLGWRGDELVPGGRGDASGGLAVDLAADLLERVGALVVAAEAYPEG